MLNKARSCAVVLFILGLLAGCAGNPQKITVAPSGQNTTISGQRAVVNYAMTLRGTPYRWGKESPNEGFDCSGFVQYVFSRHGVILPRTAKEMASHLLQIDQRTRQPGDLVFFNTTGEPYSHVGIYIGNDAFVHSSSARGRVIVSALNGQYWLERLLGFRRPGLWDMQTRTR